MAESCKRNWISVVIETLHHENSSPTISVLKWIKKISNGPIDICFSLSLTSGSCCAFFFFYCGRFGDLVISDPRLIGRYLFFDFLGSENSFQAKGEIEEKGNDNRSEWKGRRKRKKFFEVTRRFISKAVFSLSLSSTERLVITASFSAVQTCLN